jgi:hypothetical protein
VFGPFLPRRSTHRRPLRSPWERRWRALTRHHLGRWFVAAAPVLALIAVLALLAPVGPNGVDLAHTWDLAGRIGVVVVTALIGRAMLNQGR